jgi:excisionase family DNA binding protein
VTDLLTLDDVATACQISERTVRRAIERGELQAAPLGRRGALRIKPDWVDEWLERRSRSRLRSEPQSMSQRPRRRTSERGRLALMRGTGHDPEA